MRDAQHYDILLIPNQIQLLRYSSMQRLLKMIPARRLAKGSEMAELALFLASDNSDFIVGQVIPFAGGWVTTV